MTDTSDPWWDPDDMEPLAEFIPTPHEVIDELTRHVCALTEPWAGPDYHDDHGHTFCLFAGWAIKYLTDSYPSVTEEP